MTRAALTLGLAIACSLVSRQAQTASAGPVGGIEFTTAQSAEGKIAYDRACRQCHGRDPDDGDFAPPLRGSVFTQNGYLSCPGRPFHKVFDVFKIPCRAALDRTG